jgi:hypothetical protein
MSEKRVQRAQRLFQVLTKLHYIEEQKKIALQRRFDELERSQEEVIKALNTDDALHGLFVDTTAKLLRNMAQEAHRVGEARDLQTRKLLDRATKMKTVERLKENLEISTRRIRQEHELREIIERYVGRQTASLPQD